MGGKKSGGAATPYEAPNTLNSAQSLRIIDAVCEGEIRGFANGNDAPWKSVFLNDTPVQNADGSFNFKGLAGFFLRGTPDQPYIPGFDVSERTVAVSAEVKKSTPIVRAVTDKLVGRLRVTLGVDPKSKVLKSPFVVQTAGGKTQMALSGDFVADGLIHGRHIAAGQTLSSPSIEGGSLNIGNGMFTVASDGSLAAQNAVVRGRIEAESGYFKGTVKASRIEGDVMKVVRMNKLSSTVWEALIQAEDLPMMVRPDFEVRTVNPDHFERNQAKAEFLVDGARQPVSRSFETRVTSVLKNEKYGTIDVKTEYTATTSYGWYVLPRNKSVLLRLQLAESGC